MLTKTKKIALLTSGLAGALLASSLGGVVLSSCTVQAVDNNSSTNSNGSSVTLPDSWYTKEINWSSATAIENLIIDANGLVYSSPYMTEIIAVVPTVLPNLGTVRIPASVKYITGYTEVTTNSAGVVTTRTQKGAFEGTYITNVIFEGNNVEAIGQRAFYNCTNLQSVNLTSRTSAISDNAFNGCTSLSSINLNNITLIGNNAFSGAMVDVAFGSVSLNLNNLISLGTGAFQNATGLGNVNLSSNKTLLKISDNAFNGCTYLSGTIDLSNDTKLISIGANAFQNCSSLVDLYINNNSGLKSIGASAFSGATKFANLTAKGKTGFNAPIYLSTVGANAFNGAALTSIDLSLTSITNGIGIGAFANNTSLATVNLGTTITTLSIGMFANDTSLKTLTLPSSITSIAGITTSTPPTAVNNMSSFFNTGLTSIDLSTITSYATTTNDANTIPQGLFMNCSNLETVILKETTSGFGYGVFYGTSSLKTVRTSTQTYSSGFTATSSMSITNNSLFEGSGIESVDISQASLLTTSSGTTITLPASTFHTCRSLREVKIPTNVTEIGQGAFYTCTSLSSVNFTDLTSLLTINSFNFTSMPMKDIDLSNTKINTLGTAGSEANLFSLLDPAADIKLPSTLWNVLNTNVFSDTDGLPLSFSFPNGFSPSATNNNFTTGANAGKLVDHTMFSYISKNLSFSNFSRLKSISKRTFFGNTTLTGLTFGAKSFLASDSGVQSKLQFIYENLNASGGVATAPSYIAQSLPFGSNSGLTSISFDNFTTQTPSSSDDSLTIFNYTSENTWKEVAAIMNSFAKIPNTTNDSTWDSVNNGNLTNWVVNVSDGDSNSATIKADVTATYDSTSGSQKATITYDSSSSLEISSSTTSPITATINGIEWTITINEEDIVITGTGINTYRSFLSSSSSSDTNNKKVFFNTKTVNDSTTDGSATSTHLEPNSDIKVTMTISKPTTTTK